MKLILQKMKKTVRGIFFIVSLCCWAGYSQSKDLCPVPSENTPQQSQVCFFALNGPDESKAVKKEYIQQNGSVCSYCLNSEGKAEKCPKDTKVVKEFYACSKDGAGGNVSRAFEEMTKERCDGLVISGHHLGYYTGGKTKQDGDREAGSETLDLSFLEELSCFKEGDGNNCREWFSNIKYVHLHGSYTAGRDIESGTFDHKVLKKMKDYSDSHWRVADVRYLNREYASTVSQHNPLQSRYLRMFPESLVFGWTGHAPTIGQGSPQQIVNHMKTLGSILEPDTDNKMNSFVNQLSDLNEPEARDEACNRWSNSKNIAFLYDGNGEDQKKREESAVGCHLSEAIRNKNKSAMKDSLASILGEGCKDSSPCRLLQQNMNRIFAINKDHPEIFNSIDKNHQGILLNGLEDILSDADSGFVNKANALYLYKQLGGAKLADKEKEFFTSINDFYADKLGYSKEDRVYKEMLAELIWKNNLGQTLSDDSTGGGKELINKLITQFDNDDLEDQALLIEAATLSEPTEEGQEIINSLVNKDEITYLDLDYIGLQIQNKRYKNFHFLNNDKIDQKTYGDIVSRIVDVSLKKCIKNPLQGIELKHNLELNEEYEKAFNEDCHGT